MGADIQGNSYYKTSSEVIKFDDKGVEMFRFSNKLIGDLSYVDVTQPLRPLLFYKDMQKLVITDNTLSQQNYNIISFDELGMYQITCVAGSKMDNGFWVYDQELFQIVKLDKQLQQEISTGNLKQILEIESFEPIKMIEMNGFLYVQCKNIGILVFDIYGTYYKTIPLPDIGVWNISNNILFYTENGSAYGYHLTTIEISKILDFENQTPIWLDKDKIWFCENDKVFTKKY